MIPDAAVEAALNASLSFKHQRSMDNAANHMRAALEAAAPHMLAGAWEQGWAAREDLHAYDVWGGKGEEPDSSNPYRPTP